MSPDLLWKLSLIPLYMSFRRIGTPKKDPSAKDPKTMKPEVTLGKSYLKATTGHKWLVTPDRTTPIKPSVISIHYKASHNATFVPYRTTYT